MIFLSIIDHVLGSKIFPFVDVDRVMVNGMIRELFD